MTLQMLDQGRRFAGTGKQAEVKHGKGGQALGLAQDLQPRRHTGFDQRDDRQPRLRHGDQPQQAVRRRNHAKAAIGGLQGLDRKAAGQVAGFDEARRGNLSTRAIILGPVGALGFAALGALVARDA